MRVTAKQLIARVLPQFFPAHWLDHPGIAFTSFPSRIRIGYVLRMEGAYSYVLEEQLASLKVSLDELHAVALTNLAELPSASISIARIPGGSEGWIEAGDDNFAAVRILLPEVQQEFCEALGKPFLVSLPHRDDCFCWSTAQPIERQERNAREARESFLQNDYNLTPDILLFSHAGFHLHQTQIVGRRVT